MTSDLDAWAISTSPWMDAVKGRYEVEQQAQTRQEKERAQIAAERSANFDDIGRFARKAFPEWVDAPDSRLHRFLDRVGRKLALSQEKTVRADKAPRGHAKSTRVSKVFPLWIVCHQPEIAEQRGRRCDFILLVSNHLQLPKAFMGDIKRQLLANPYLERYYPEVMGQGSKWTEELFRTANGVWVLAGSTGRNIRGASQDGHRPQIVICDDLENLENVQTLEQRNKAEKWFDEDLRPVVDKGASIWVVGNLIHKDSLLMRLSKKEDGTTFRAILQWSPERELWDEWTNLYLDMQGETGQILDRSAALWQETHGLLLGADGDVDEAMDRLRGPWRRAWRKVVDELPSERDLRNSLGDCLEFVRAYEHALPDGFESIADEWDGAVAEPLRHVVGRRTVARQFFEQHQEAMLQDTRVLWPEWEPYYDLMCQLVSAARAASFWQEKQNQPIAAEEQTFREDSWRMWEAEAHPSPASMRDLFPEGSVFVAGVDPSMGKQSRKNDPWAIVVLGGVPGEFCRLAWARIKWQRVSVLLDELIRLHRVFDFQMIGFETNQAQAFMADEAVELSRRLNVNLPIVRIDSKVKKEIRIQGMEPVVANGYVEYPGRRISSGDQQLAPLFQTLWDQFLGFGAGGDHDDGPDAFEMAYQMWRRLKGMELPTARMVRREPERPRELDGQAAHEAGLDLRKLLGDLLD